jgi:hypothetical protein
MEYIKSSRASVGSFPLSHLQPDPARSESNPSPGQGEIRLNRWNEDEEDSPYKLLRIVRRNSGRLYRFLIPCRFPLRRENAQERHRSSSTVFACQLWQLRDVFLAVETTRYLIKQSMSSIPCVPPWHRVSHAGSKATCRLSL